MSKRISFACLYQKEIDRLKTKMAVASADGIKAKYLVAALKDAIDNAEKAKEVGNEYEMLQAHQQMKIL